MRSRALEQLAGFIDASLARAQLPEPHQAAAGHPRPGGLEVAERAGQLDLRRRPVATTREHRAVRAAADPARMPRAPALRGRAHHLAPLDRAREVADPLARGDHVAERPAHRDRQLHLLAGGDRGRLVEPAHALAHARLTDEREPFQRRGRSPPGPARRCRVRRRAARRAARATCVEIPARHRAERPLDQRRAIPGQRSADSSSSSRCARSSQPLATASSPRNSSWSAASHAATRPAPQRRRSPGTR